jgi:TRAP-type C4-dicarboxylate transport system permease small subunit
MGSRMQQVSTKAVYILTIMSKWLDHLVAMIVIGLLICMVGVTSAGVLWRYGFNSALSWSEELARFLLIWVSFLGAALATYRDAHIGISVVFDRLPPLFQRWVERLVNVIILLFLGAILVHGIKFLPDVSLRTAPTLQLRMDIPYLVLPISSAIMMFHLLVKMIAGAGTQHAP